MNNMYDMTRMGFCKVKIGLRITPRMDNCRKLRRAELKIRDCRLSFMERDMKIVDKSGMTDRKTEKPDTLSKLLLIEGALLVEAKESANVLLLLQLIVLLFVSL